MRRDWLVYSGMCCILLSIGLILGGCEGVGGVRTSSQEIERSGDNPPTVRTTETKCRGNPASCLILHK